MKKLILLALTFSLAAPIASAFAGNCDSPDDRAADGSRCGGRSSQSRPGGK